MVILPFVTAARYEWNASRVDAAAPVAGPAGESATAGRVGPGIAEPGAGTAGDRNAAAPKSQPQPRDTRSAIKQLAQTMAEFASENRDCNFKQMSREILGFLRNIVEVDGQLEQQDETAIEKIEAIFNSANKFSVRKKLRAGWGSIGKTTGRLFTRQKSTDDDREP